MMLIVNKQQECIVFTYNTMRKPGIFQKVINTGFKTVSKILLLSITLCSCNNPTLNGQIQTASQQMTLLLILIGCDNTKR